MLDLNYNKYFKILINALNNKQSNKFLVRNHHVPLKMSVKGSRTNTQAYSVTYYIPLGNSLLITPINIFLKFENHVLLCHLHGGHLGFTFFIRRLSVRLSVHLSHLFVNLFRHTFSSCFQITFFLLNGLNWNFWQMFISMCVMGSQKGDNQNIFIIRVIPLFCQKK